MRVSSPRSSSESSSSRSATVSRTARSMISSRARSARGFASIQRLGTCRAAEQNTWSVTNIPFDTFRGLRARLLDRLVFAGVDQCPLDHRESLHKPAALSKCLIQSLSVSRDPQQATTSALPPGVVWVGGPRRTETEREEASPAPASPPLSTFRHGPANPLFERVVSAPSAGLHAHPVDTSGCRRIRVCRGADEPSGWPRRFPHKTTGKVDRRGGEDRRPMGPPTAPSPWASVACAGR